MKIAPHFDPKIIHIEGIKIFDKPDINRVLSEVNHTFKSSPKKISNLDENEKPSKRTVELEPGIWTVLNNNFGRDNKEFFKKPPPKTFFMTSLSFSMNLYYTGLSELYKEI